MTDHIIVEESFVEALVENAAWDAARVGIQELQERGGKKGDKPAKGKKGDKPDFTTKARKGDKSKTDPGKMDYEDDDEKCESVEAHTCHLCESELQEALTDEQIQEHILQIQSALQSIEEEEEIDEEEETEDTEEVDERTAKVKAKVKELKAASKG